MYSGSVSSGYSSVHTLQVSPQDYLRLCVRDSLATSLGHVGTAQAELHNRGGGMIYDDVLDITWLWDANYAQTSGYDSDGLMGWEEAVAWAAQLSYGGYDDWRLPSALNKDGLLVPCDTTNVDCPDSELGHLFHVTFGFGVDNPLWPSHTRQEMIDDAKRPFINLQLVYWTGTTVAGVPGRAWAFLFDEIGYNLYLRKGENDDGQGPGSAQHAWAWAVRDGDVAQAPPLPVVSIDSVSCNNGIVTIGGSGFGSYNNTAGSGTTVVDIDDSEQCAIQSWTDNDIVTDCGSVVDGSVRVDNIFGSSATVEVEGCESSGRPDWWSIWSWWSSWSWSRR